MFCWNRCVQISGKKNCQVSQFEKQECQSRIHPQGLLPKRPNFMSHEKPKVGIGLLNYIRKLMDITYSNVCHVHNVLFFHNQVDLLPKPEQPPLFPKHNQTVTVTRLFLLQWWQWGRDCGPALHRSQREGLRADGWKCSSLSPRWGRTPKGYQHHSVVVISFPRHFSVRVYSSASWCSTNAVSGLPRLSNCNIKLGQETVASWKT